MFRKPLLFAAFCAAITASAALAQTPAGNGQLRYEVEKYTSPGDAWESNHFSANKWNLWSTDKDADKKWSGGVVLQSPVVQKDRASAEEGAPPLHTRITGIPAGTYVVELLHVTRPLAVSLDGKNWQRKDNGDPRLGIFTIRDGAFEVWVDDRYAADPPGSSYYDALLFTPMTPVKNGVSNGDCEANAQRLDGWSFFSRTNSGSCAISTDKRTGQLAARVWHDGERDWAFTNTGRLDVQPGQVYTATGWVKGQGSVELALVALSGGKILQWSIGSDGAQAGGAWKKLEATARVPEGCDQLQVRFVGMGKADLSVDDVTLGKGVLRPRKPKPPVQGYAKVRVREPLNRGMVAMPLPGKRVYVGWRLLASDAQTTAFNLYRQQGAKKPERLNRAPLSQTTDFVDPNPPAAALRYFVRPVLAGREGPASESAVVTPVSEGKPYLSIKLQGDYTFQKVGIGDLDGDGRYDYVIKQPNGNVDPYVEYWQKSTETFKLEAYRHDGKFLWRYDLGWAIERGIWYSPYIVFDLDGDGRAEVAAKTGVGDPRDKDGRVTSGPEYLSILDGRTGKLKTRVPWPSRDGYPDYNYYCRNQLGIAYLDGKTPCLIVERGTYNTIKVVAYQYHGGKLRELWNWNDREEGPLFRGQGAHSFHAADVDGDGRDEVILGSAVLDDNGVGLWSTGRGHPDHVAVGDLDPRHPGMEIQYNLETRQPKNGISMVDAKSGKLLWGLDVPTTHVHAQGLCADIDPAHPGTECYGGERDDKLKRWLFGADGTLVDTKDMGGLAPQAVYWDGDAQRELLRSGHPTHYLGGECGPRIEGSVTAIADVLGDWREEVITTVAGELRIYTTTIPATDRRVCLMQDPINRIDVAGAAQGYLETPSFKTLPGGIKSSLSLRTTQERLTPGTDLACTALVAANGRAVNGTLQLSADGATITPASQAVSVAAGTVTQIPFTLHPTTASSASQSPFQMLQSGASRKAVTVRLSLPEAGLQSETALPYAETFLSGVPMAQAENLSAQAGGEVQIRTDKPGVFGKAISHWDNAGHRLSWQITVPRAGRYALALRYCCPDGGTREIQLSNATPESAIAVKLPATGGFGDRSGDWQHTLARAADGAPLVWNLPAGACTISLTNTDGHGINLDYLALAPAE